MSALLAALSTERSRNSALKQQLSALIAAGHADLAQRSESATRQIDEATVFGLSKQAALEARVQAADAALAGERCSHGCLTLCTVYRTPYLHMSGLTIVLSLINPPVPH